MDNALDRLTRDGTVPQDAYRAMGDAIQHATEQGGKLFNPGQAAHYQALAAAMALRAAGYSIGKTRADA